MKGLEREGIPIDSFESYLFGILNRSELITRAIKNYIGKNLIITNLDAENNKKINTRASMLVT